MKATTRPAARLLAAGLTITLGACGSAQPSVSDPPDASPTTATASWTPTPARPVASPGSGPTASAAAARDEPDLSSLVDLGLELDVGTMGGEAADAILEFASDGSAVIFSSGAAPDVIGREAAPDLWRLEPGPDATPELVWKNEHRDHSLVKVAGDLGAYAFVDMPLTGEREWTLWFMPRHESVARTLDRHPGDEDVPSFVPSFAIWEDQVVWTAFDRGPEGAVSQLLHAEAPSWEPRVLLERPATRAELWLPSLYGSQVAFVEVIYASDRSSDERHVYLMSVRSPEARRRLDTSGRATMPVIVPGAVLWKEADPGFNMFNWGRMFRFDLETGTVRRLPISPQEYVNYPSAGGRFAAWRGADSFSFGVYDHLLGEPRLIELTGNDTSVLRPHVALDLLVWMRVVGSGPGDRPELRWAFLPDAADLRRR